MRGTILKLNILIVVLMATSFIFAATETNLLQGGKIDFPLTVNDDGEKLAYLSRARELLRLEHNAMGKKYRDGEITENEWQKYLSEQFEPKNKQISHEIAKLRENYLKPLYFSKDSASSSDEKAYFLYKKINDYGKDTKYDVSINLDNVLK